MKIRDIASKCNLGTPPPFCCCRVTVHRTKVHVYALDPHHPRTTSKYKVHRLNCQNIQAKVIEKIVSDHFSFNPIMIARIKCFLRGTRIYTVMYSFRTCRTHIFQLNFNRRFTNKSKYTPILNNKYRNLIRNFVE